VYRTCTFHLNNIPALKDKACMLWLLVSLKFSYLTTKIVWWIRDLTQCRL